MSRILKGTSVNYCSNCGQPLPGHAAYCSGCGHRLASPIVVSSPLPRLAVADPAAPGVTVAVPWQGARHPARPSPLAVVRAQLQAVPWRLLLPVRSWLAEGEWHRGWFGLFGVFALTPFVLLTVTAEDQDVSRVAWGFAGYFALLWFIVLYGLIRPQGLRWWTLGKVVLVTAVVGTAVALFLERFLAPDGSNILAMVLGVGVPEEIAKAIAVYLFVFLARRPSTPRTYLFLGAVSGLTFGAVEAVAYTRTYTDMALLLSPSEFTGLITWRLLSGSLLHAAMAGICAYFMGLASRAASARWVLIIAGVGLAGVLHGTYNTFSDGWLGTLAAALIVFVFIGYARTGDQIAQRMCGLPPSGSTAS